MTCQDLVLWFRKSELVILGSKCRAVSEGALVACTLTVEPYGAGQQLTNCPAQLRAAC